MANCWHTFFVNSAHKSDWAIASVTTMRAFLYACLFFTAFFQAQAVTTEVTSISSLNTAISSSSAGDIIVLADGTYLDATITISKNDITVRPKTLGGAYLNGVVTIKIKSDNVIFEGFQFTSGVNSGIPLTVQSPAKGVIIRENNFYTMASQKYINLQAGTQYCTITKNNFEGKPASAAVGCLIQIMPQDGIPNYHVVSWNRFKDILGDGGDYGNECIRVGLSTVDTIASRTIVEYNYFTNTAGGDSEAISSKSNFNIYRYNTFENNQEAQLVIRSGANNIAYGNFFSMPEEFE
jgi:poly(beta-D-mannuronate) lyase